MLKLTVTRNGAQSSDQRNFKSTISHDLRQTRIADLRALKLFASRTAAILESVEIAYFTNEGSSSNDTETDP